MAPIPPNYAIISRDDKEDFKDQTHPLLLSPRNNVAPHGQLNNSTIVRDNGIDFSEESHNGALSGIQDNPYFQGTMIFVLSALIPIITQFSHKYLIHHSFLKNDVISKSVEDSHKKSPVITAISAGVALYIGKLNDKLGGEFGYIIASAGYLTGTFISIKYLSPPKEGYILNPNNIGKSANAIHAGGAVVESIASYSGLNVVTDALPKMIENDSHENAELVAGIVGNVKDKLGLNVVTSAISQFFVRTSEDSAGLRDGAVESIVQMQTIISEAVTTSLTNTARINAMGAGGAAANSLDNYEELV